MQCRKLSSIRMVASCSGADTKNGSSCSGICQYSCDVLLDSEWSPCQCWSLDTSLGVPVYISKLARALSRVVQHNDIDCHAEPSKPSCFHCKQAPSISIKAYVQRIAMHSKCSPVCFIMAWSYLKQISQNYPELAVTSCTVHRLLVTAVMLAAKLMDDKYYNNAYYAKIGGITTCELNHMELEMLHMLEYRMYVTGPQIKQLLQRLEVFQMPGRLNSVLCRRRSCHLPDSAAPQLLVGVHKPKAAKGYTVTQRSRQPTACGTETQSVVNRTTAPSVTHDSGVPSAALTAELSRSPSESCVVSANPLQLVSARHSVGCIVLPTSISVVEVSA